MLQSVGSQSVGHNLSNEQQTIVPINIKSYPAHSHTDARARTCAHTHTHTSPVITSGITDAFAKIDEPTCACVLVT